MIQVHDNLWRGPRPESFNELREKGFERVISLQSGSEEYLTDSLYEMQDPEDFGIQFIEIPCSNIFPPSNEEVSEFLLYLENYDIKTYVHCHSGVDRTGFMIAAWRMSALHWPFHAAYSEMKKLGRHWWFGWWKYRLKTWERLNN